MPKMRMAGDIFKKGLVDPNPTHECLTLCIDKLSQFKMNGVVDTPFFIRY